MFQQEYRRSLEQGHTKACYANALICAIENWRDDSGASDFDFAVWVQEGGPRSVAIDYLHYSVLVDCKCPPIKHPLENWNTFDLVMKRRDMSTPLAEFDLAYHQRPWSEKVLSAEDQEYRDGLVKELNGVQELLRERDPEEIDHATMWLNKGEPENTEY